MLSSGSGSLPNGDHGKDRIQHIRAFSKESAFHLVHLLFHICYSGGLFGKLRGTKKRSGDLAFDHIRRSTSGSW